MLIVFPTLRSKVISLSIPPYSSTFFEFLVASSLRWILQGMNSFASLCSVAGELVAVRDETGRAAWSNVCGVIGPFLMSLAGILSIRMGVTDMISFRGVRSAHHCSEARMKRHDGWKVLVLSRGGKRPVIDDSRRHHWSVWFVIGLDPNHQH